MKELFKIPTDQLVLLAVMTGQLPRYLYKYRFLNDDFDNLIAKNQLWFSSPAEFNDPFDCQLTIDTKNRYKELKLFIEKNNDGLLSPKNIKKVAKKIFENPNERKKLFNEVILNDLNSRGLCCFCAHEENILLWSHYADSHKGVCLKFDVTEDPDLFIFPIIVKYEEKYPVYNHLRDGDEIVKILVGTKAKSWEYENEVRVMKPKTGGFNFNKSALVEILFGCNCSQKQIDRVKDMIVENGYSHVKFKKGVKKETEFGLDFVYV